MCLSVRNAAVIWSLILLCSFCAAGAKQIQLAQTKPDPYGWPRPWAGEANVPLKTSFFIALDCNDKTDNDVILPESVTIRIQPEDGNSIEMLSSGRKFNEGYSGKFAHYTSLYKERLLTISIESKTELKPVTKYFVTVTARSKAGSVLSPEAGQYSFTTEDQSAVHPIDFLIDLAASPARWHGGFFTGFCKTTFCTSAANRIPSYELMDQIRKKYPKAFSLVRDIWPTGMEHDPTAFGPTNWALANVVRERETRRIMAIEKRDNGMLLGIEDFFGHRQYGIDSNRPISGDYHLGDEILIADGKNSARAKVLKIVSDSGPSKSLLVTEFNEPAGGWRIQYIKPLPTREDPNSPGLFPPGGCYLRKFLPTGTPQYYWGRWDKEYDIHHRRYGRRLLVNFCDAPGDLSVDGQNWTYPKDYIEYHQVVHAQVTHLLDRYGKDCQSFFWSVYNEVDLASAFWRSKDWDGVQKFYDYTVDAVCCAFEDKGYDSNNVLVGGLELGGISGANLEEPILKKFLIHCSPKATGEGSLPQNVVYVDKKLDGKRSNRTEKLCRANNGKGSPCDFISVHTYNASAMAASKLITAKKIALDVDPDYYAALWVNSGESCPDWTLPPDDAAKESFMGNGYWTAWTADMSRRQLAAAAQDKRYGFGETLMSVWPGPNRNFDGNIDNETRAIDVDDNGDGKKDRAEVIAEPIMNFVAIMSGMGDDYIVLPERQAAGQVISGFATKTKNAIDVLVYAHNAFDTQSRSNQSFAVTMELKNIPWKNVNVKEYRFDKDYNSYYRLALELRNKTKPGVKPADPNLMRQILAQLESSDPNIQMAAVKKLSALDSVPQEVVSDMMRVRDLSKNEQLRTDITAAATRIWLNRQVAYTPAEVARVKGMATLHVTKEYKRNVGIDGTLKLPVSIAVNSANFVVLEPATNP